MSAPGRSSKPASAKPAQRRVAPLDTASGCNQAVAFGKTVECDFGDGGGTATYSFTTAGPDTVRGRVVTSGVYPSVTVEKAGSANVVCSWSGSGQSDCGIPSAGTYQLTVTASGATSTWTTLDSVRQPALCSATLALAPGSDPYALPATDRGASGCVLVPATSGDVISLVSDGYVTATVYDSVGNNRCSANLYSGNRWDCAVSGGSGYRLFVTQQSGDVTTANVYATKMNAPAKCASSGLDTYGATPVRTGTTQIYRLRCSQFSATAGHPIGVHLVGTTPGALSWQVRSSAGTVLCQGGDETIVDACPNLSTAAFSLFIGSTSTDGVDYSVDVLDLAASTGCSALPGTDWTQVPSAGTLSSAGEVDCRTFPATSNANMRITADASTAQPFGALVVNAAGAGQCQVSGRSDCTVTGVGPYRVVVSQQHTDQLDYGVSAVNTTTSTGCAAATSTAFNAVPDLSGDITSVHQNRCFALTLPVASHLGVRLATTGNLYGRWELRSTTAGAVCSGSYTDLTDCTLPNAAATYLLVVSSNYDNPQYGGQLGSFTIGVWRVDAGTGCAADPSVSFSADSITDTISAPVELNCVDVTAAANSVLYLRARSTGASVNLYLYNASGVRLCQVGADGDCTTSGKGPYHVVVASDINSSPSYTMHIAAVTGATGCTTVSSSNFGVAPTAGFSLTDSSDMACLQLTRTASGAGTLVTRLSGLDNSNARASLVVYRANTGTRQCQEDDSVQFCSVSGSGQFTVVITAEDQLDGVFGWTESAADLGCTDMGQLAFGLAPAKGSIDADGAVDCRTVTVHASDQLRLRFGDLARGTSFGLTLTGAGGNVLCSVQSQNTPGSDCSVSGAGPYRLLTYAINAAGAPTGDYSFHAWQLNRPAGCSPVGSVASGFGPLDGALTDPHDVSCYSLIGSAGDNFAVTTANNDLPGQLPLSELVRPDGNVECSAQGSSSCTLQSSGQYAVLVGGGYGTGLQGHYSVSGTCTNPACGPDEFTVAGLSPNSAGAASNVTIDVRGRALSLSNQVSLARAGSDYLVGTPVQVSADGRALSVKFDLAGAAPGVWDLKVTGPGGAVTTVPHAFTVKGILPAAVKVTLVGRDRFVPGRDQTLTVEYQNTGNVDALGVPVFLHGLPLGSVVKPLFPLTHYDPDSKTFSTLEWNQKNSVYQVGNSLEMLILLGRVPGASHGTLQFSVTIPSQSTYNLQVGAGACFNSADASTPAGQRRPNAAYPLSHCLGSMVSVASAFIPNPAEGLPGAGCVSTAKDVATTVVANAVAGDKPLYAMDGVDMLSTGLDAAACVAGFFPGAGTVVSGVLQGLASGIGAFKSGWDLGSNCADDVESLSQHWVSSFDPNEMVGPTGGGTSHALRGTDPFTYAIYFENKATASASAQEVQIQDQLDPSVFDLSTLRVGRVVWGTHVYTPDATASDVDDVVDLRPDDQLEVNVTAKASDSGLVRWDLASIDPTTGKAPEDPDVGFLPPNDATGRGQGVVYFTVSLLRPAHKEVVTNKASIVFDTNAAIETNAYSNVIDQVAPTSKAKTNVASTTAASVPVTWNGTDDGSGVRSYTVYVSQDGGDYTPWLTDTTSTSGSYPVKPKHTYSFTSVAFDLAGNGEAFPAQPDATVRVTTDQKVVNTTKPALSGAAKVGSKLVVSAGKWTPKVTLSYRWLRNGKAIAKAAQASYVVTAADLGAVLSVVVTAAAPGYTSASVTLKTSKVAVGAAPKNTKRPKISGTAKVGKRLAVSAGSWSPTPKSYQYVWRANGKSIKGATKSTFTVTKAQRGKTLTVVVTAVLSGHTSGHATSPSTAGIR